MTRLYVDLALAEGETVSLPPTAAHHVRSVLRLGPDSEVELFDGRGNAFGATLTMVSRNAVDAVVGGRLQQLRESPLMVTLVQCISRGERMDYTLQKAVELGVGEIIPVVSQRTVVRLDARREDKRAAHWRGVIQHASEQSGRSVLPKLGAIRTLAEWTAAEVAPACFVLHPHAATPLARQARPPGAVHLVAGPEGGFEVHEIEALRAAGASAVGLGPRVLRTETAAVCALAVMQALWGDLA